MRNALFLQDHERLVETRDFKIISPKLCDCVANVFFLSPTRMGRA